ncbi:diguanylate cyclase [Alteromonas hispanica]|uniref:diguanylate cyclase n=1 Tax=Alteromonas hispanica TaxID=315421 RepID=A0A6L9MRA3_9ALTE|nr:diguanylate cyclase [Alteromonas hispanica]
MTNLALSKEHPVKYFSFSLFLFSAIVSSLPTSSLARASDIVPLFRYFPQTWNTQSGLPHNSINALAQTSDGYIWAGTWEGLARYNGATFDIYTRGENTGLPDSGIRSLFTPPKNNEMLVAGSRGGFTVLKDRRWNAQKPASSMINHAFESSDNSVWLALEDAGLEVRFSDGSESRYLTHTSAYRVIEDKDKRIWVATNIGLYLYSEGKIELASPTHEALAGPTFTLALDQSGRVLVGTEQGVWRHTAIGFSVLHSGLVNESVSSILLDSQNSIWIGTINHGVYRLSQIGLEKLDAKVGLPNNRIFSLLEDVEGTVWVGTNGGLFSLRRAPFTTFTKDQGLSGDYIRAVLEVDDNSVLVGSSSGLDILKNEKFQSVSSPLGRPISILSLANRDSQSVLVGTYTDGVLLYRDGELIPFLDRSNGLPSNEVRAILKAKDGRIWFGTAQGLTSQSLDGSLLHYNENDGLPAHFIMGLAEDRFGRIWIATGMGVAYIESSVVHNLTFPETSDAQYAFSFHADTDGIWMATDRGVACFNFASQAVTFIGKSQGLPVDKVFAIGFDQRGNAWITSNQGVFLTSREDLLASINRSKSQLRLEHFKEEDGLKSRQINGGSQPSLFISESDNVWLASAKGLANTTSQSLARINSFSIPVTIEEVQLDGHVVSSFKGDGPIIVSPDTKRITFKYAGLGYAMPSRIEYQTILEGYNDSWSARGQVRIAEYTNLSPNNYFFKVRARYPDGDWQEVDVPLVLSVQPRFTQTYIFKIVIVITLCGLIWLAFRLRFHHLKRTESILRKRVSEQTKSLELQTRQFEYQATHDELTGIANRRAFDKHALDLFRLAKTSSYSLCLAIIDIDHFKQVNDCYSHMVGDQVIKEVASLIANSIPHDALCARWGGEEFTILLSRHDTDQALDQLESIRRKIKKHDFGYIANNLTITVSAGLADINLASDYDRLLNHADQALYYAKQQGRDQVVVYKHS